MWSNKDRETRGTVRSYNLRDVLAQVASAEADSGTSALKGASLARAASPLVSDPQIFGKSGSTSPVGGPDTSSRHDVALLPPRGIAAAAAGALASVLALVLAHVLATSKGPVPKLRAAPMVPIIRADLSTRDIGSGPLVLTLSSLSKTVLAGSTHLLPPGPGEGAVPEPAAAVPLTLSDLIRVRASNVITGNVGAEASWPIEIVTAGIALPNGRIVIEGLPVAAKLNHGGLGSNGRWTLSPDELPGLTVTVPAVFARAVVSVALVNEADTLIAHTEASIEPVPQPEAAPAAVRNEATLQDKFNAFLDKWKRYKGRDHLTEAEKEALFVEYRAVVDPPEAQGH